MDTPVFQKEIGKRRNHFAQFQLHFHIILKLIKELFDKTGIGLSRLYLQALFQKALENLNLYFKDLFIRNIG